MEYNLQATIARAYIFLKNVQNKEIRPVLVG